MSESFIHQNMEAIIIGALAAASVLYTFQTRVQYPAWMLKSFDHPWVLLIVFLVAVFLFAWSPRVSVMLIFLVVALWMDAILFSKHPLGQKPTLPKKEPPTSLWKETPEVWPFDDTASRNDGQLEGPPLSSANLVTPSYPVFYGSTMHPIGPAPF